MNCQNQKKLNYKIEIENFESRIIYLLNVITQRRMEQKREKRRQL